jgi:hypothetical protein
MLKDLFEKIRELSPFFEEEVRLGDIMERKISHPPPKLEKEKPAEPRKPSRPFTVCVDDNFHYMDKDHRYTAGEFDTYDEALALAKKIVDESIVPTIEGGSTPEEAVESYRMFGEDPWIISDGSIACDDHFSAWSYAEQRAAVLYKAKRFLDENFTKILRAADPEDESTTKEDDHA